KNNSGYEYTVALSNSDYLEKLYALKQITEEKKKAFPVIGDVKILEAPMAKQYFPPIDETLHALYISGSARLDGRLLGEALVSGRSEEHTSELQSRFDLVCRLLLEKKKHQ